VDITKLELVVPADLAPEVVSAIERAAHTGGFGDGKIFIVSVDGAVRVRSGERDVSVL
jgi:nitrogen regulatory protein PII